MSAMSDDDEEDAFNVSLLKVLEGGGDDGFIRSSAAGRLRREVAHIKL